MKFYFTPLKWQRITVQYLTVSVSRLILMPLMIVIAVFKLLAHKYDLEVMELNALFTSLVAGTIFLIGFLISGVLTDYKESEKIPSELSASMKALFDDAYTIWKSKNSETARQLIDFR